MRLAALEMVVQVEAAAGVPLVLCGELLTTLGTLPQRFLHVRLSQFQTGVILDSTSLISYDDRPLVAETSRPGRDILSGWK